MPVQRAKDYYTGKGKKERFNCGQAILKAFQDKFKVDEDLVKEFNSYGSGRAPGNVCGAYFAARKILEKHHPEKAEEFERFFIEKAGALKCSDIRNFKKLSCLGCIEKSAEFLAKL